MNLFEDTNPRALKDLLAEIHYRSMALPDFQRDFVWEPGATQELVVSIANNYPAGSLLRVRDNKRVFAAREFEGAPRLDGQPHTFLVLDGQHRVYGYTLAKTSLRVPVVIYNGLTKAQEVRLFTDINTKQRPVPNELLLDIQQMAGDEPEENALLRTVFDKLNSDRKGPMFQLFSPSERIKGKISRVTFNASIKPLLSRFRDVDEERVGEMIGNYLAAVRQQLSMRNIDSSLTNPTVFRALFELFPRAAQRVSDLYQDNYSLQNFYTVLEPVFSRLPSRTLTAPGNSYKHLGDKLVDRLERSTQF